MVVLSGRIRLLSALWVLSSGLFLSPAARGAELEHFTIRDYGGVEMPFELCFSKDVTKIAACVNGGEEIAIYDLATGKKSQSIETRGNRSSTVAWSHDGKLLAVGNHDGVKIFDIASGKATAEIKTDGPSRSLSFSPDGRELVLCAKALEVWPASGKGPPRVPEVSTEPWTVFFPSMRGVIGCVYLTQTHKGEIRILDSRSFREVATFEPHYPSNSFAISDDGKQVVGFYERRLYIWSMDRTVKAKVLDQELEVHACAISHDAKVIAAQLGTGGKANVVAIDSATGTMLKNWKVSNFSEWMVFTKDDRHLCCATLQGDVLQFSLPTKK